MFKFQIPWLCEKVSTTVAIGRRKKFLSNPNKARKKCSECWQKARDKNSHCGRKLCQNPFRKSEFIGVSVCLGAENVAGKSKEFKNYSSALSSTVLGAYRKKGCGKKLNLLR